MQVMHLALCMGVSMCWIIFFVLSGKVSFEDLNKTQLAIFCLVILFVLSNIIFCQKIFRKKIEDISALHSDSEKINSLRAAYILKWALYESAVLLCGVGFFISKNMIYIIPSIVPFFLLLISRPTLFGIAANLNKDPRDLENLF